MKNEKVATEKVDVNTTTFMVKKSEMSLDRIRTMRKDLNRNFNNMSQIFNYIRGKNAKNMVKDILVEEFKDNEQMVELTFLILNNGWLNVFESWHDADVDVDEEGNPIKRYKKHPTTPAMFLTRLKMMVKNVYADLEDGTEVNENVIRRTLGLEIRS